MIQCGSYRDDNGYRAGLIRPLNADTGEPYGEPPPS